MKNKVKRDQISKNFIQKRVFFDKISIDNVLGIFPLVSLFFNFLLF